MSSWATEPSTSTPVLGKPESVDSDDSPAIRVEHVSKRYGTNLALNDVTVDVPTGVICGLVGPNGAGKSTLLSIVATLLKPTTGDVLVFGHSIAQPQIVRPLFGYVPDFLGSYTGLSVTECLEFFADAHGLPREQWGTQVDSLLELVDLTTKRSADVNTLSRGMKQRLGLALGLMHEPRLLLLDEPASGLDARARIELREIITHLNSTGITVLISSHILSELEEMCSHTLILERGQLVAFEDLADAAGARREVKVRFLDGSEEVHDVADDLEQVRLVHRLVADGRDVLSVVDARPDLEQRFFDLTKGELN